MDSVLLRPPSMYVSFPTIPFLAPEFENGRNLFDINEPGFAPPPTGAANQTYIFLPERFGEFQALQEQFPNGTLQTIPGFHANPLFYAYEVRQ